MTTQQAINQLNDLIQGRQSLCNGNTEHDAVYVNDIAALKIAVAAISRQIPKNIVKSRYSVAFCPVCGGSAWQNRDESKYCFRCGQALKWG